VNELDAWLLSRGIRTANTQLEMKHEMLSRGFGTGATRSSEQTIIRQSIDVAEIGRKLWRELFETIDTAEQLKTWEKKIPNYGCYCREFYRQWKADHPPTFPLLPRWKYDLKSAVNEKLGHQNLTYEEACSQWGWKSR
jgi:hypothetical protein